LTDVRSETTSKRQRCHDFMLFAFFGVKH
jgi:hypothetical protein